MDAEEDVPEEVLAALPLDPLAQLHVARRISSLAMASRVSAFDPESGELRQKLGQKETLILDLQQHVVELQQSLQESNSRLSLALNEQARLTNEKNVLIATVKKLNHDVAKLETFKRTLMQALHEDEEISSRTESDRTQNSIMGSSTSTFNMNKELDSSLGKLQSADDGNSAMSARYGKPPRFSLTQSSDISYPSNQEEEENTGSQKSLTMTPQQLTPTHLTPTGSPKRQSATASPLQGSPRWQSNYDGRISLPSSLPTSQHTTAPNSPPYSNAPARKSRVDGKEFFRQARNRLSYEQFSIFLANIKELNARRQTREETLKKADEIFGISNKDLYTSFENLLSRHAN